MASKRSIFASSTAVMALAVAGYISPAQAANECGAPVAVVVNCNSAVFPGSPGGNTNGGIEYNPSAAITINLNSGSSVVAVPT